MNVKLPDFTQARLLVVGDLMLDRYWAGPTSRISPEAPVPIVKIDRRESRAGGAGNVALNIASLKMPVSLLGVMGQDEAGDQLQTLLSKAQIETRLHRVDSHPTITKVRILSRQQQLLRLDFEDPFTDAETQALNAIFTAELAKTQAVILSDYGKGVLQDPQFYIKAANQQGKPVLVDPKGQDFERYRGATLITPNLSEFEAVVGRCTSESDLIARGHQLMKSLALNALLITRSEKGMTLLQQVKPPLNLPTHAREVYDVTGAGDTVIAVFRSCHWRWQFVA
jgi:D-beta-D-heptose 7-phosphate kinase/D-beta-D-heptose 1-phosphate adenosyltransferase